MITGETMHFLNKLSVKQRLWINSFIVITFIVVIVNESRTALLLINESSSELKNIQATQSRQNLGVSDTFFQYHFEYE